MKSIVVVFAVIAVASAGNVVLPAATSLLSAPLAYAAPVAYAGPLAVPGVAPVAARVVVPAGSGLEGQYVPDNLEKLYDDGSYRPELSPIPLSPSPYGLTPSGSGLEGQYVPDLTEKLFDDGSYKPGLYA